jgi:hypothetical protein
MSETAEDVRAEDPENTRGAAGRGLSLKSEMEALGTTASVASDLPEERDHEAFREKVAFAKSRLRRKVRLGDCPNHVC